MKVIFLSLATAYILVEILGWHRAIKRILGLKPERRIKPLDCFGCLAFWISIGLVFAPEAWLAKPIIVTATAVLGYKIGKRITEWKLK